MKAIKTAGSKAEKKVMRFTVLITTLVLLASAQVEAQIDPSSAMLLNSNHAAVRDGGLDSGRYTVKPRIENAHPTSRKALDSTKPHERTEDAEVVVTPTPAPVDQTSASQEVAPIDAPNPGPAVVGRQLPRAPQGPQSLTFTAQDADQTTDQTDAASPAPVAKLPRDERRFTMLELSFAPGYLYNESKSTFAPRNYSVNAPSMGIDASVWTSPSFGLHTNFNGTINANVTDSLNNTKNASASEQWFSVGARTRSFFGEGPLAPTLQFGIDYREFQFRVPNDTLFRNKLATSGLILLLDAEIPTSNFGAWVLGGEFGPRLSHAESSNAVEFRSGQDPQTTSIGVHVGARYRFDHTQSIFWKISYGIEKNLFSGSTSINDPINGLPQSNVSVTSSFSLFQLGYTWAN